MHLLNKNMFANLGSSGGPFPLLSMIVINFNGRKYLGDIFDDCIESIRNSDYRNFEVLIVDNGSSDNSIQHIEEKFSHDARIKIIALQNNLGTTGAKNAGIKASKGKYVLLLNNDIYLNKETIRKMVQVLESNSSIGILGCKLVYPTGEIQSIGEFFSDKDSLLQAIYPTLFQKKKCRELNKSREGELNYVDYVIGAALMTRKKLVTTIKLYDDDYFMYSEELDLAYRVKKLGYKVACLTSDRIIHHENATAKHFSEWKRDLVCRNILLFFKKNYYGIKFAYALFTYLLRIPIHLLYSLLVRDRYPSEEAFSYIKAFTYVNKPALRPS
jgi:GT2 family glycosyltransferase